MCVCVGGVEVEVYECGEEWRQEYEYGRGVKVGVCECGGRSGGGSV